MNLTLKMAMIERGTTQVAIANKIGLKGGEPRMSRIVRGYDEATDDEKKAIAKLLRKPIHELFPEVAA